MPAEQFCRQCGCSEFNACIDPISGFPCHWVEADLCSACDRGLGAFQL